MTTENSPSPTLIDSPDGSGRTALNAEASSAFEFKCPVDNKRFTTQVHCTILHYYVIQLLSEMCPLQCNQLLYLCYTAESTTVFYVKFSYDLWKLILVEITRLYG